MFSSRDCNTAVVAVLTLRGVLPTDPLPEWHAADQLLQRMLQLVYTALLAAPIGWLLRRTNRWWMFPMVRGATKPGRAARL